MKNSLIICLTAAFTICSLQSEEPKASSNETLKSNQPNVFLHEKDGIYYYETPANNGINVMQYQLRGSMSYVEMHDDFMVFQFKGVIEMRVTGVELFNPHGKQRIDKWEVLELPVRIKAWNTSDQPWAANTLSFQQAFDKLKQLSESKTPAELAVKLLKLTFGETGDLIGLEGEQIVIR